ncbi:phage major capsid protein [Mycobacterium sp. NPDC051198]
MSLTTSNSHGIVVPETLGELVIAAAARASVALRASTVVVTPTREYRVPVLSGLPSSSFVSEGQELSLNDATIEELTIIPAKVGHVAPLSRELVRDSFNEGAPEIVATAQGIDIAKKIDQAFFGGDNAVANDGLGALADVQEVDAGAVFNLDAFAEAQAKSEDVGGVITSFVANPETALALAQLKRADDSNEPLLQAGISDPTQPTARQILGSQLLVSPAVDADVIWAIPQLHSLVVVREDVETEVSTDVFFTSDRVAVKTTARVGWGFPHPGAVVKINLTVS